MEELLRELIEKVDIQIDVHSFYECRTKNISIIFKLVSIIVPALITFSAFTNFHYISKFVPLLTKDDITLFIGCGAFIVFLNSVFNEIFNISTRYKEHRSAIEQYTELKRDLKMISLDDPNEINHRIKIELYNQRYIQISSNTISFTEKQFNKATVCILRQYAIRKVIKKQPFVRFWQIRNQAMKKSEEISKKQNDECEIMSVFNKR